MSIGVKRSVAVAVTGLLWLSGCETTSLKPPEFLSWKSDKTESIEKAISEKDHADATGAIHGSPQVVANQPGPEPDPASCSRLKKAPSRRRAASQWRRTVISATRRTAAASAWVIS